MPPLVTINQHTTASVPRPHILYTIEATRNGVHTSVARRYSEFVSLNDSLSVTKYTLPPKRILVTTFFPSAWLDDTLISERKAGLQEYLLSLLQDPAYSDATALREFILPTNPKSFDSVGFNPEDALPSTMGRKAALAMVKGGYSTQATMIAASYYPDWSADSFPPEGLNYAKFDILFFAFATPNSSSKVAYDSGSTAILKRLVASARASGHATKIVLSVGGWGGSYWFSNAVSTADNRTTFLNSLVAAVNTYGLDGIDIDWEYPNSEGAGNPHASADSANLLTLLKRLRTALGTTKIISAAVPHLPWLNTSGNPLTDASAYAAVMTYVNIMNYDVWGASSKPGPNAPLSDACGTSTQPRANAQAALNQWKAAGFKASQLLLGLPLYGYVSQSTKTGLTGSLAPPETGVFTENEIQEEGKADFVNGAHPRVKDAPAPPAPVLDGEAKTLAPSADLRSWYGQQIAFSSIVASGALVRNADGSYGEGGGFTMAWDDCSDTPFLYKVSQSTVVTYDDTWSLADKAAFARTNGMAGCFTWSLDQDDGVRLQNVIRSNLGL